MKKMLFLIFLHISLYCDVAFSIFMNSKIGPLISKNVIECYAKNENLRIEINMKDKRKELFKYQAYWLYNKNINILYIVNPKDNIYSEFTNNVFFSYFYVPSENENIKNVQVKVKSLGKETIDEFETEHLYIQYSYEYSLKFNADIKNIFVQITKELWVTERDCFKDVPKTYKELFFLSGINKIDSIIFEKIGNKKSNFTIKYLNFIKIKEDENIKEYQTEMTISNISFYDIPEELFMIPKDYKKVELIINK